MASLRAAAAAPVSFPAVLVLAPPQRDQAGSAIDLNRETFMSISWRAAAKTFARCCKSATRA